MWWWCSLRRVIYEYFSSYMMWQCSCLLFQKKSLLWRQDHQQDLMISWLGLIVLFQMVACPAAWLDVVLDERLRRQYRAELVPLGLKKKDTSFLPRRQLPSIIHPRKVEKIRGPTLIISCKYYVDRTVTMIGAIGFLQTPARSTATDQPVIRHGFFLRI